jgi:choline dehydrogenase-like flavoprotein
VGRILVNDEGLASGIQYFDRHSGTERSVPAKRVVLAASCVDSTRILLNSKSRQYPNGIGNGSGVIGKYLCEQVRFHVQAFAPELLGVSTTNDDGISGEHIYIPRFDKPGDKKEYLRGYGIQLWGMGCQANASVAKKLAGFGLDFKKSVKRHYPAVIQLHPYGEVLPRATNRITVEGTPKDRYGLPIMRIEYDVGENERRMVDAMYSTVEEILHEMKAEVLPYKRGEMDHNGSAIHEHGTCRMGKDPKRSALNGFGQMHEVKNVFVVDGSSFPTATEKNPTLTILAVAWRATDYLAEQMKKQDV